MLRSIVPMAIVAALAGVAHSEERIQVTCMSFATPSGWARVESKTGADAVVQDPNAWVVGKGTVTMRDNFIVRTIEWPGKLADFKSAMVAQLEADAKKRKTNPIQTKDGPPVDVDRLSEIKVNDLSVAGVPAFEVGTDSVVDVGAEQMPMRSRTRVALMQGKIYIINASIALNRLKIVLPMADRFFASVKWDGCPK